MSEPRFKEVARHVDKLLFHLNATQEEFEWVADYLEGRHALGRYFRQTAIIIRGIKNRIRNLTASVHNLIPH